MPFWRVHRHDSKYRRQWAWPWWCPSPTCRCLLGTCCRLRDPHLVPCRIELYHKRLIVPCRCLGCVKMSTLFVQAPFSVVMDRHALCWLSSLKNVTGIVAAAFGVSGVGRICDLQVGQNQQGCWRSVWFCTVITNRYFDLFWIVQCTSAHHRTSSPF